jgi:hypothetical protein
METPKYFDVNVSFTPIHDFVPQLGNKKETALITPSKATNSYLDDTKTYNFGNTSKGFTSEESINPSNLKQFSTNGSADSSIIPSYQDQTITIPEAQGGPTNFTGNAPVGNAPALIL